MKVINKLSFSLKTVFLRNPKEVNLHTTKLPKVYSTKVYTLLLILYSKLQVMWYALLLFILKVCM